MLVTNNQNDALCAFGRLPVVNGTGDKNYLNKVKSHENFANHESPTIEEKEWENESFIYLEETPAFIHKSVVNLIVWNKSLKITYSVQMFKRFISKESSTIEVANSEIKNSINEGSSIIAFYGHSAAIRLGF